MKISSLFHSMRGGPDRVRAVLAVFSFLSGLLFFPAFSPAASLTGTSNTYLTSRENQDKIRLLPAYEYLDVSVQSGGDGSFSAHFGGWGRYDLANIDPGAARSDTDLQYGYLSYRRAAGNAVVNLGRVMVFEGVAAERVDGLYARTDLAAGFGASAFGGVPVLTSLDGSGSKSIYGARLSHQFSDVYRLGVSALQERHADSDFRKEAGADLWLHPFDKVDLTGRSTYNDLTKNWMEHAYVLSLGPFERLRLDTLASQINYDDYFFASTNKAFAIQSGIIEPHEKAQSLGEEASLQITDNLLLAADYRNFKYSLAGRADYYGGRLKFSSPAGGAGLSYHRMEGAPVLLKYNEYRIYGYKQFGKLNVTLDALDVAYDVARNGVIDAYSASLAALYELAGPVSLGADAEYSKNPNFNRDVKTFFKLIYRFGAKGGT